MLERESTGDGWQVRFTPTQGQRLVRFGAAAFLGLWLCGWAMGEYFAGGALAGILADRFAPGMRAAWLPNVHVPVSGAALPVLLFLSVWVTAWTTAGCFAIGTFVSLLFGVPVLRWSGAGVEMVTLVGPFASRRRISWEQAEALVMGKGAPQRVAGKGLQMIAGPLCDETDRDLMLGWLREARGTSASEPEPVRAIG
jgi:hypothetical protein